MPSPPPPGPRSVSYSPDIEIAQPIRKITSHTNASVIMAGFTSRASGAVAFCTSGSKSGQCTWRSRTGEGYGSGAPVKVGSLC